MELSLAVTLLGLLISLVGTVGMWRIKADDPRFEDDGMLTTGRQRSKVLPAYLNAIQRPTCLILLGGSIQVVGGVGALAHAVS